MIDTIFNTPSIDINAIDEYNNALNRGLTKEDALARARNTTNQATIKLMESTDGAIDNAEELARASTLAAKAQSAALQALSTIGNMAMFAFISAAVQFAATAISNWIHRVEIAKEAMQEAVSEYESTKSNLESINSELEQQNQII